MPPGSAHTYEMCAVIDHEPPPGVAVKCPEFMVLHNNDRRFTSSLNQRPCNTATTTDHLWVARKRM